MTTTTDPTLTGNTDPTLTDATSSSPTTSAPVVTLDQADADYSPGETVGITASNVAVGGTVTFDVEHVLADGTVASDLTGTGTPWTATDGGAGDDDGAANGVIQTSWYVNDDAANQAFTLSATDATGGTATVAFTDKPNSNADPNPNLDPGATQVDLTAPLASATINDALFVSDAFANTPSGTGVFPAFVQVDGNPDTIEQGYNYDKAGGVAPQFDEGNSAPHNHAVLLSELTILEKDGKLYYSFALDSNEPNSSTKLVSLDALQVYTASSGDLTGFDQPAAQGGGGTGFGADATLVYDMDGAGNKAVLIDSTVAGGSGKPDLVVYIPVENFADADPATTYVYLYSAFGYQGGQYDADSGFEEWSTPLQVPGEVHAGINIVKTTTDLTNGHGPGDGITATAGDSIQWTYTVTNTGDVALSNVTVTDDAGTPGVPGDDFSAAYLSGDADNDGKLDTNETWIFTKTGTAVDTSGLSGGDYNNVGTATGHYLNLTVNDTDPSSYTGSSAVPHLTIVKETVDGSAHGDGLNILSGESISWTYKVTNDGTVDLTNIVVVDDNGTAGNTSDDVTVGTIASLAAGASTTLTLAGTAQAGSYHNNATATAGTASDDDDSSYSGLNPHLTLVKETVDGSAHGDGLNILSGESISWTYKVTNDGNVDLSNIVVVDDNGTAGDTSDDVTVGTITSLAAGDSTTLTLDGGVAGETSYHNTATATADAVTDTAGHSRTASDDDDSSYSGLNPHLTLVKETVDGSAHGDGLNILSGESISWTYKVTNDGNVDLSNIVVVDDNGTAGDTSDDVTVGTITSLAAGDSTTLTLDGGVAGETSYHNTATATADAVTDTAGHSRTASDDDDSSYFGANPDISIAKYIVCPEDGDLLDANTAVNLLEDGDGQVEYRIVVTNTGNVALVDPSVTDSLLTLGAPIQTGGSGDNNDTTLDVGETWTYTVLADWTPNGPHLNTATASVSFSDDAGHTWSAGDGDGVSDSASYFGLNPHITLTKLTNGSDGPDLLQGQAITWTYDVKNDGNVGLTGVSVSDSPSQTITAIKGTGIYSAYNSGDTDHDGVLDQGETWHFMATGTAGTGLYTNTATATTAAVTDDCGDSVTPTATDGSSYTGHAVTLAGLTKGYWATHLTLWDVYSGDEKGSGSEINVAGKYDWNKSGGSPTNVVQSDLTSNGPSSSLGLVKTTSKDSGLLMGDVNHDGLVNDGHADLFFDLTSAQLLANNSVSGDARIILGSQAVAAQLNEYNDYIYDQAHGGLVSGFTASPNGLLAEAVRWLTGDTTFGLSANGHSNVDTNTANDAGLPAKTVINDAAGNDYTVTSGVVTLGGTAMSSSDASWQTKAQVFSETAVNLDINGDGYVGAHGNLDGTVWANGEGLKNALEAYNTAKFVVSTDGTTIGWAGTTDTHANAQDVFWGILANQGVTGVEWHHV
jgi:uncharacterized repeat protein (TIGR01451 family)